jgi:hypothetical protein
MSRFLLGLFVLLALCGLLLFEGLSLLKTSYQYGVHYPNGVAAVNYIYGPDGMWKDWKELEKLEYHWNYYPQQATPDHPQNRDQLVKYANGNHFTTTRDVNGHLLLDFNHTGMVSAAGEGGAFFEHNGKGVGNQTKTVPFTNFWFDDNWLARYMARTYDRREPYGLSEYHDFTRWQVLDGDTVGWIPYNQEYFDTLALDGLYYLAKGEAGRALVKWRMIRDKSGYYYDVANQRYQYPNILEIYHLALFKILTDKLIYSDSSVVTNRDELLQHSVSQRSNILSAQERNGPVLYGWLTSIGDTRTLMNTEAIAASVLALGASARYTFEVGPAPLAANNGYFLRSHNVLSAVAGQSPAGQMVDGPTINIPTGSYKAEFLLRAPNPAETIAELEVRDASTGEILGHRSVSASDLAAGNRWTSLSLDIIVKNDNNKIEFRINWLGQSDLDVAYVQLR